MRKAPVDGLTPQRGNHLPALTALDLLSTRRLDGHAAAPEDLLDAACTGPPCSAEPIAPRSAKPATAPTPSRWSEHDLPQERGHPAQVIQLADVQHVTARKPVQRTVIPVLP